MQFRKNSDDSLEFIGLDPFLAELIRQIPCAADPQDDSLARARLFSRPATPEDDEKELLEDWEELVIPELKLHFGSAVAQVSHDIQEYLCDLDGGDDFPYRLKIPIAHADAWLSALNQARLVLAERFRFEEEELSRHIPPQMTSLRDLALYQINVYALLQELIISDISH